ncbi:enoyl-CoA hydratase/isomerase family protein [Alcaligenaceae bacterium]|nr:enoyl-CoA hydratase/isomerase family protein [Alcaligenaceae bacterium]
MTKEGSANVEADTLVGLQIQSRVATITLNRPDRGNALNDAMVFRLVSVIDEVCCSPDIGAVLLTGTGRAFCVGGDIKVFQGMREALADCMDILLCPLNQALLRLERAGLPIVVALNGPLGGGGIGLGLMGDYVLAAESVKLRCGYTLLGLSPDAGSSWVLMQRVGVVRARQLLLFNTSLDARECLALGLVDRVCADAELLAQARATAQQLADGPRDAQHRVKQLVGSGAYQRSFEEHLELERRFMIECASGAHAREGVLAFTEKRKPVFS